MSELKGEDFKAFEAIKEQEHAATKTLQLIHDEEQPRPETNKGKAKVERDYPLIKELPSSRPVDEAAGSSKVFSITQWQTQMTKQIRAVSEAYHLEVSLEE